MELQWTSTTAVVQAFALASVSVDAAPARAAPLPPAPLSTAAPFLVVGAAASGVVAPHTHVHTMFNVWFAYLLAGHLATLPYRKAVCMSRAFCDCMQACMMMVDPQDLRVDPPDGLATAHGCKS